jgi:hypothetical protein
VSNCPAEKIFAGSKKVRTGSYTKVQPAWLNSEETEMGRQFKWSENKIKQLEAEGRGKGIGATYLPWVLVSDFSSLGDSRRIFSNKTGRVHHLMSNVEWGLFLLMEFAPDVVDIREQYPLPRNETQAIAAQLGIKHPYYPGTKVATVMTVDFLITRIRNGAKILEAYDCKRTEEAEELRSMEKLEIHRNYFDGCTIPHHLVFHSMLPVTKVKNLEWIRSAMLDPDEVERYPGYFEQHGQRLSADLAGHNRDGSLASYCENYDSRTGAEPGTGLRVIRMLLQKHLVVTDLNQPDLAAAPVSMFKPVRSGQSLKIVGGV